MLDPYLVLDLVIVTALVLVGLVVILKDSRPALNRIFAGVTVTTSAWILSNYFSNSMSISRDAAEFANHLALFFPGTALILLLYFALIMTHRDPFTKMWGWIVSVLSLICVSALTPLVITSITRQGDVYAINFGPVGTVYFAALLAMMVLILSLLSIARKHTVGEERNRISVILLGLGALMVVNVATNTLLPLIGNTFILTNFGPLSSAFLVYALWYSIVKHRLFDVRFVVARSLAYVLSLGSLIAIFSAGAFALTSFLFKNADVDDAAVRAAYSVLAILLAFIFAPLKRFFDRISNQLFFQDAYDSQQFLDKFNKLLVATYDLSQLLRKSGEMITNDLKLSFALFNINATENTAQRLVGTKGMPMMTEADRELIRKSATSIRRKTIVADDLEDRHDKLRAVLRANNIAMIVRLAATHGGRDEGAGYLMLGPKKSGNMYNKQDIRIIEIIANELVIAIQNSLRFEEIENFNATLQARVTEATRKLRRTNEKLKALDEAKDDFVSMASHQLRTPLTSIKGYTSMVLEGDAGKINATQRKLLEQSFFSSQRMVYLIADLLNVSRLKTGKFVIEPVPVDLSEVVQQEIGQLTDVAAGRQLTLTYKQPKSFPSLMLDETKTRQVIMNFIDNAIYYTPAGGNIEVKLVETPSSVEFQVIDDGIGVPKSEQPHLFTKFYRAGNARKARPDGTGLGLFMAKKVVVAEGGAILFTTQEGKGSTFGFVFSKSKMVEPDAAPLGQVVTSVTAD